MTIDEMIAVMTINEMIAVMQAYRDGKRIQCRFQDNGNAYAWQDVEKPSWDFFRLEYRIAPEPRTIWVTEHKSKDGPWFGSGVYDTKEEADRWSEGGRSVQFREVL